jgi:single stranded DNA-binding protein
MPTNKTRVVIRGRMTKSPHSYVTSNDKLVASTTIAVDDDIHLPDGTWKENTMFYIVEGWSRCGEKMMKNFAKGDLVHIEGKLKQSRYIPNDSSEERIVTKIWIDEIDLVAKPKGNSNGQHQPANIPHQSNNDQSNNDQCYDEEQYAHESGRVPF